MNAMHRTQIYLDDMHYALLRSRARREGRTIAALIREILDLHLGGRRPSSRRDAFDAVIGIGRGDGTSVAENDEDFLYGEER
jgi:plasmid stability protein